MEGLENATSLPFYKQSGLKDSNGIPLKPPTYEGIQSLVEYLYYVPAPGTPTSLYEEARLETNMTVKAIIRINDDSVDAGSIGIMAGHIASDFTQLEVQVFDYAVVTCTQWAAQMSMVFDGFDEAQLPQAKLTAKNTQHNISSCKLFFPLKEKYWKCIDEEDNGEEDDQIPQVIITDTYIQDVYGVSWETKSEDNGVLLASYTWEDDSLKLLPFNEEELKNLVLGKLKYITTTTVGKDITEYIDADKPVKIQWIEEPSYVGCSKLYREYNEGYNMLDLSYNQNFGKESNLYFAGENYGVEGGWTEPALRSALDCVMQLLKAEGAAFLANNFDFESDYPKWPDTKDIIDNLLYTKDDETEES